MIEFGLKITSPEEQKEIRDRMKKFVLPENDGSATVHHGGYYGYYMDMESNIQNDAELILRYRDLAAQLEVDRAIEHIVNEAIVFDDSNKAVEVNTDDVEGYSDNIKKKVSEEFDRILKLLNFGNRGYDIFRNWYVDGRIYYHLVMDEDKPGQGIQELNWVDPRKIRKVREIKKKKDTKTGIELVDDIEEYFIYNEQGITNAQQHTGLKIAKDAIAYVPSGILNPKRTQVVSYLHSALKPHNQLRILEDAAVIYRLARAPERRLFYIDVGTMSTTKANQYVKSLQTSFRNKLVYDANTGEIRDDRKFMSMLEDFWLPRREGGRGTEISTLPGGQNLSDIDDINYFKKKLYESLKVPVTRLEEQQGFSIGRAAEITRDEQQFSKFIAKIRNKFSELFDILLEKQLVVRGVLTTKDWNKIKEYIWYDWRKDINIEELKELELWNERLNILDRAAQYRGEYLSKSFIQKKFLRLTEEEIKEMDKEIDKEPPPPGMEDPFGDGGGTSTVVHKGQPGEKPPAEPKPIVPNNAPKPEPTTKSPDAKSGE